MSTITTSGSDHQTTLIPFPGAYARETTTDLINDRLQNLAYCLKHLAADQSPEALAHKALQEGRIAQITNLLIGYLPSDGCCSSFKAFIHMIWNAVKSLFGYSDLQVAQSLAIALVQDDEAWGLDTAIRNRYADNFANTQQQIRDSRAFHELQSSLNIQASSLCTEMVALGNAVYEQASIDNHPVIESFNKARHEFYWMFAMKALLDLFPETSPNELRQLLSYQGWNDLHYFMVPRFALMGQPDEADQLTRTIDLKHQIDAIVQLHLRQIKPNILIEDLSKIVRTYRPFVYHYLDIALQADPALTRENLNERVENTLRAIGTQPTEPQTVSFQKAIQTVAKQLEQEVETIPPQLLRDVIVYQFQL